METSDERHGTHAGGTYRCVKGMMPALQGTFSRCGRRRIDETLPPVEAGEGRFRRIPGAFHDICLSDGAKWVEIASGHVFRECFAEEEPDDANQ